MSKERWSQGLPDDILQLIAQRLYISDYQVFRQVCPDWRAAVDRGIATRSCPPAPQPPWLLLLNSPGIWARLYRETLDALYIENQYSFLRSPTVLKSETYSDSYSLYCVGSVESWLIVAISQLLDENFTLLNFFFNPLSRARVMIPSDKIFLKKTVASSPPARMQQNNCFVAGLRYDCQLGICRPTDTSWTIIETRYALVYKDLEIIDTKLYVAGIRDDKYTVLEFDVLPEDDNVTRAKYNCSISIDIPINWNERPYLSLVKDSASKMLFIVLHKSPITKGVRVYKMEGRSSDGKPSCEEVTDLGDRILFLSSRSNKVMNDKTLGTNCIYFAFRFIEGFWVYSLMDMSHKRVNLPKDYSSQKGDTLWFTPHPW